MAHPELTPQLALLEEAVTILFCRVDDIYYQLNPKGRHYETLKELSDSEVITLALFQQLRGVESERSFLREVARFFSHLFPGAVGLHPSSLHRRVRNLRRYFEPLRRAILGELVGEPETLIVDSTLLAVLHPREVSQSGGWGSSSAGAAWVRWGSFSIYGVKLHLICATNRVPISYELTPANVADLCLTEELLAEADLGEEVARKLLGDLAYRSGELEEELAESGIVLLSSQASARRPGVRQQIEICFSTLKRIFGLGETLATTLVGLATRIAAKMTAYTYAFLINRMMGRPQGKIKELWA
ncbi:MAG: transposase [Actinobacteria bacterium]|nr:transposase [Actinomycetota bacterium]